MSLIAPRLAPGIGVAMARVATRFYFFSILLVAATVYLPQRTSPNAYGLLVLGLFAAGMIVFLSLFPWDRYEPRVFSLTHLLASSVMLALLVYFTGGSKSGYSVLFFLIILFSYFYNLTEMISITTVVSFFFLLPFLYEKPEPYQFAASAVTVLFFYLGTYILHGVTRFMLKKNKTLEELNNDILDLSSLSTGLLADLEADSLPESFAENLKDHIPTTYCILLLLDDQENLVTRLACPVRSLAWEPAIGSAYRSDRLPLVRSVFETRQPALYRLEFDAIDEDLKLMISKATCSVLVVPVRTGAENGGVMIFGEERHWNRSPITHEKIQLAVAISKQVSTAVQLWRCHDKLAEARRSLEVSRDSLIKAERLATLGEVTRAVEHEINNPLSVIVNWSEIYRDDPSVDAVLRNKFQIIYDMAIRIMGVVRRLSEIKDAKSIEFIKGQRMTDIK
jgi:hypothetical protein